jgi:hypothetical protein
MGGMETVVNSIFLDHRTNWMFDNPVKITLEFDYDSPPKGSAILFTTEKGLYADMILDSMAGNYLDLYPHISFSKNNRTISSIKLSTIEHSDERVKTIDQQTTDFGPVKL